MGKVKAVAIALGLTLFAALPALAEEDPDARAERWTDLKHAVFGDRVVTDGTGVITLDAPARAQDAALVPISVTLSAGGGTGGGKVKAIWLLVDGNPSPLAGHLQVRPGRRSTPTEDARPRRPVFSGARRRRDRGRAAVRQ